MKFTIIGFACKEGWQVRGYMHSLVARVLGGELIILPDARRRSKIARSFDLLRGRRKGDEIGIIIAGSPGDLRAVPTIPNWRRRFACLTAYVFDSWYTDWFSAEAQFFDALFVSRMEDVEPVRAKTGRPVHHLPFGTDVLDGAAPHMSAVPRPVDLLVYGRQPPQYVETLDNGDRRLGLAVQSGVPRDADLYQNQANIYAAAAAAKYALGFCNTVHYHSAVSRSFGPFLTFRWLDNLAAGATMAGVLPRPEGFKDVVGWDGANVDLSLDPSAGVARLKDLADSYDNRIAFRNHYESLIRNDWRLRIRDLLEAIACPPPPELNAELARHECYRGELTMQMETRNYT